MIERSSHAGKGVLYKWQNNLETFLFHWQHIFVSIDLIKIWEVSFLKINFFHFTLSSHRQFWHMSTAVWDQRPLLHLEKCLEDIEQFLTSLPPIVTLLLQRPYYCSHKILDPLTPKIVTSFMDDPLEEDDQIFVCKQQTSQFQQFHSLCVTMYSHCALVIVPL